MKRNILIFAALSVAGALFIADTTFAVDVAPAAPAPATQPASDAAALVKQLGDDDFHVRQAAAEALKAMGKSAVPALQEARKSPDPEIHARAEQLLGDMDHPAALPVPKPTGVGSNSMRVSIVNGAKTVDVEEPGRTTHIEEDGNGIAMKVTGDINGKQVTREYKAKNAEQLKKENPEAFALYQQHNGNGGIGPMQLQVGGVVVNGNLRLQVNGGGGVINIGPNGQPGLIQPPVIQPAIPLKPAMPGGDNLDQLESRIADQMKAANLPEAQQDDVKGLLKQLREALPQADKADKDLDAQMREYNRRCDALRQKLSDLKLPDPGDALPPPVSGRLGISATEESIPGQGLVVTHILPDSRAEKIGLKEQDVIQKVNGQEIHSTKDLRKVVTENPKGLVIEGLRDGKAMKLEEPAPK